MPLHPVTLTGEIDLPNAPISADEAVALIRRIVDLEARPTVVRDELLRLTERTVALETVTAALQARAQAFEDMMAKWVLMYPPVGAAVLEITTSNLPDGTVGIVYSAQLQSQGATGSVVWSIVAGQPSWLTLNPNTGGLLGIPDAEGPFTLTVQAADDETSVQRNLSASIAAAPTELTATTTLLPNGQVGVFYTSTLQAINGTPPYTWSQTTGTLPDGLTLTDDTVSGTPTTAETAAGLTFRVTDDVAATDDTGTLSIIIADVTAPVIANAQFPTAEENVAYGPFKVLINGGVGPHTISVTSGALPSGLTLTQDEADDWFIDGTADTPGVPGTFTLAGQDSEARPIPAKQFTINVVAEGTQEGAYDYFDAMVARPDHILSFKLNSNDDLAAILSGGLDSVGHPQHVWEYKFSTDTHAEAQDAAKLQMSHTLAGGDSQLQIGVQAFNIVDGDVVFGCDFYHTQEFRTNTKGALQHKFWKLEQTGDNGIGVASLFNPKRDYNWGANPFPDIGRLNCGASTTQQGPEGIAKAEPYTPSGFDTVPPEGQRLHASTWTRQWYQVHVSKPGNDPVFDDFNATYDTTPEGHTGTYRIATSTPQGGGVTLIELTDPGRLDNSNFSKGTGAPKQKVTISGHSDNAINGTWNLLTYIDTTHFTLAVDGAGGTGGVVSKHFHAVSEWFADEARNVTCLYRRVPVIIRHAGQVRQFRVEINTSGAGPTGELVGGHISTAPTVANPTTVEFSAPHSFVVGEPVLLFGLYNFPASGESNFGRVGSVTTVSVPAALNGVIDSIVSPTSVTIQTIDHAVSQLSDPWPAFTNEIQQIDLGDIGTGDTFRLVFKLTSVATPEETGDIAFSTDMTVAIKAALDALPAIDGDNTQVAKLSDHVYTVTFFRDLKERNIPPMTFSAVTGFTAGSITTLQDGSKTGNNQTDVFIGTHGYVAKQITAYCRGWFALRNVGTLHEDIDLDIFQQPVR